MFCGKITADIKHMINLISKKTLKTSLVKWRLGELLRPFLFTFFRVILINGD